MPQKTLEASVIDFTHAIGLLFAVYAQRPLPTNFH